MLKVNACADPETYRLGAMGEGSSQNWFVPLFSWQNLFLFIGTFIKLCMKRKQFLWRGRKKTQISIYVGLASKSKMKLLEQSIKWINALEPSVIQSVYVMKFYLYSSLLLSGSFISLADSAAYSQLRQPMHTGSQLVLCDVKIIVKLLRNMTPSIIELAERCRLFFNDIFNQKKYFFP